jgi:hypothetical protein
MRPCADGSNAHRKLWLTIFADTVVMRSALALIATSLLAGCVSPSGKPQTSVRPVTSDAATRQCLVDLGQLRARFTPLPEQDFGNGCAIRGAVQLSAAPVPVTNIKAIRCPMARAVTLWLRDVVQPAARAHLGENVAQLDAMGAYACRRINGASSGKLSEHATANAIDIGGFRLADGRRVSVLAGWNGGSDKERAFLREIRSGACKRFQTVLSPDYNAAHYDHLHFDMGRGPFCR